MLHSHKLREAYLVRDYVGHRRLDEARKDHVHPVGQDIQNHMNKYVVLAVFVEGTVFNIIL